MKHETTKIDSYLFNKFSDATDELMDAVTDVESVARELAERSGGTLLSEDVLDTLKALAAKKRDYEYARQRMVSSMIFGDYR